jgi:hypothetical protein
MQLPKWLNGWEDGKNIFESSLIIDIPDVKVVKATIDNRLVFVAIAVPQEHNSFVSENNSKHECNIEWKIFYDTTALLTFTSQERINAFIAGAVAASSGNASVYNTTTKYISNGNRPAKGNAPVLLDYNIAKKIDDAKKKNNLI